MMNDKSLFSEKSFRQLAFRRLQKIVSSALPEVRNVARRKTKGREEAFSSIMQSRYIFFSPSSFPYLKIGFREFPCLVSHDVEPPPLKGTRNHLSTSKAVARPQATSQATSQPSPALSSQASLLLNTRLHRSLFQSPTVITIPHSNPQHSSLQSSPVITQSAHKSSTNHHTSPHPSQDTDTQRIITPVLIQSSFQLSLSSHNHHQSSPRHHISPLQVTAQSSLQSLLRHTIPNLVTQESHQPSPNHSSITQFPT